MMHRSSRFVKKLLLLILLFALIAGAVLPVQAATPIRLQLNGETVRLDVPAFLSDENRTMVPIRFISENLGFIVRWDAEKQQVTVTRSTDTNHADTFIEMVVGERTAKVNGRTVSLDSPVTLIRGTTFVPIRFVTENLHTDLIWDGKTRTVKLITEMWSTKQTVTVNGRNFDVNVVYIPKYSDVTVALGGGEIGKTSPFEKIAENYKAKVAINGAFFEAYANPPEPWGTLIDRGELMHVGNTGTTIGFTTDGTVLMEELRLRIFGEIDGKRAWSAYNFNRTPSPNSNAVYIYNQHRGETTKVSSGVSVIVEDGKVTNKVVDREVQIPKNGYVIHFSGSEIKQSERFEVGQSVSYSITYQNMHGEEVPWEDVQTAVGAGPRLVRNGQVSLSPAEEGFRDPKILTQSGSRSAIGVMKQGTIVLATVDAATIEQWAMVMRSLGTVQAMNLDGGASSGLYVNGQVVTSPGRELSNVLIFK